MSFLKPTRDVPSTKNRLNSGRVVTFYSFKGGVGRSMALANIAYIMARDHQYKVIAVDWDLEAPGLHRYFNIADGELGEGVIDFLTKYKKLVRDPNPDIKERDLSIKSYLKKLYEFEEGGSLHLLSAGSMPTRSSYVEKVRAFNWDTFYADWNGAQVIEGLRKEFKEAAQITLIDSRTGFTDVGGVCTVQLPDTVVFVFVFNEQNLSGIEQIAQELTDNHPVLQALGRKPELLFLPSRKELSEVARLRDWESHATDRFQRFCNSERIRREYGNVETYFRKASVPYVPYFAYGEELAATTKKGLELAESFQPLMRLLVEQDAPPPLPEPEAKPILSWAGPFFEWAGAVAGIFFMLGLFGLAIFSLIKYTPKFFDEIKAVGSHFGVRNFGAVLGGVGAFSSWYIRFLFIRRPKSIFSLFELLSQSPQIWWMASVTVLGSALGVSAAILFSASPYYPIASLAAGLGLPPILQRFFWIRSESEKNVRFTGKDGGL